MGVSAGAASPVSLGTAVTALSLDFTPFPPSALPNDRQTRVRVYFHWFTAAGCTCQRLPHSSVALW